MENQRRKYSYKCLVKGCQSTNLSQVVMVSHPKPLKDPMKCMRWLKNMEREDMDASCIKKNTYICGLHWVGGKGPSVEFPDPTIVSPQVICCDIKQTAQHEQVPQIYITTASKTTCTISVSSSSLSCATTTSSCTPSSMSLVRIIISATNLYISAVASC